MAEEENFWQKRIGTVTEHTAFHIKVLLDSSKEVCSSTSILSGATTIAKVTSRPTQTQENMSPT